MHWLVCVGYSFTGPECSFEVPCEEEVADVDAPMVIDVSIDSKDWYIIDSALEVKRFFIGPIPLALEETLKIASEVNGLISIQQSALVEVADQCPPCDDEVLVIGWNAG